MVIKPKFGYNGDSFDKGLAWVELNGKYGYINKKGEYILEPTK